MAHAVQNQSLERRRRNPSHGGFAFRYMGSAWQNRCRNIVAIETPLLTVSEAGAHRPAVSVKYSSRQRRLSSASWAATTRLSVGVETGLDSVEQCLIDNRRMKAGMDLVLMDDAAHVEPLHAARIPLEEYNRIRAALGEAVWHPQYQQRPVPADGGLLKLSWFKRYADKDLPKPFDRIIQSWDTANTVNEWSAYSVCTTWGLKGKDIYLLHVYRARLIFPDLKKAVLQQAKLHGPSAIYIEDHASGTQILQQLKSENFGLLRPVKPASDKATRMINQTARIENGFVYLPTEAAWLAEYEHELSMFPHPKYSDQIDSTSQALEAINIGINAQGWLDYAIDRHEAGAARRAVGMS